MLQQVPMMQALDNSHEVRMDGQHEDRPRDLAAEIETLNSRVLITKQRVAESLARALEAPAHDFGDPVFTALYDEHCRDREALFSAMRDLDKAIEKNRTDRA